MKKRTKSRILSVLLICVLVSAVCPVPALASGGATASGNWIDYATEPEMSGDTTYVIDSAGDLAWIASQVNTGLSLDGYTIEVSAPLNLSDHFWTPIGNSSGCFAGTFNGNGNKISGLTIGTAEAPEMESQFIGLFGNTFGGEINGIELEDVKLFSSYTAYYGKIGAIVANSSGTRINNVSMKTAEIRSTYHSSSATHYDIGGIVGKASGTEINNAMVEDVTISTPGYASNLGGIAGTMEGISVLDNCHVTGTLENTNGSSLGGIVGKLSDLSNLASEIKNCYSACILKGYSCSGGFGGMIDGASVMNCYSTGGLMGVTANNSMAAGFVGKAEHSTFQNCFSRCDVIGTSQYVGGFAAYTYQCTYSNNYAATRVMGSDKVGGFFGSQWSNTVSNCYSSYVYCFYGTGDGNINGVTPKYDGDLRISSFADLLNANADSITDAVDWVLVSSENSGYPRLAGIGSFDASYAPVIINVTVSGPAKEYETLEVSYDYFDINSIKESGTSYQWYRAEDSNGTGAEAIAGANTHTYTLTNADVGRYICVDVTPSNGTTSGTTIKTGYVGAVSACPFTTGDGTPDNAFIIKSFDDLMHVSEYPSSYFRIDSDAEINEVITSPICSYTNPFTGNFNGNRKTLNVNISESNGSHVGLFGYIYRGVVSSVAVKGSVSGTSSGTLYIGGLAGYSDGKIADCESDVTITANSGTVYAGGLVGYNNESEIYDNCVKGSISGTSSGTLYIGGLAGYSEGKIADCESDATITANGGTVYAGGLVGCNLSKNQNTNDRPLSSKAEIESCSASGSVSAYDIKSDSSIGGLVGANTATYVRQISPSFYSVTNSYATGDVTVDVSPAEGSGDHYAYVGGLVGYNMVTSIKDCYATGDVIGSNLCDAGGLVGYSRSMSIIEHCFASGDVSVVNCGSISKNTCLGGLIGYLSSGTLTCAYTTGDVWANTVGNNGSEYFGGLLGYLEKDTATVNRAYATGAVRGDIPSGKGGTGGLVGKYKNGTFTDAYWNSSKNTKSDGNSSNSYGTVLPTILMTGSTALDAGNMSGLGSSDFVIKANVSGEETVYYPQLKVFAESDDDAARAASLASVTSVSDWYLVTVTVFGNGTVSATGGTDLGNGIFSVKRNTDVILTAQADTGYDFAGWYEGDTMVSSLADYTFTVTEDMALTAKFLKVAPLAPEITIDALPGGTVGTAYSQTLTATGDEPITWTLDSGNLPDGLSLSGSTISGTPTAAGTFTFTVKATNEAGIATKELSIVISAASTDKTLISITAPEAISGLDNGTEKTELALGLPAKVTLVTDDGNVQADVSWDVDSCSYDPENSEEQTFSVTGTVTLPDGVINPNNVELTVSISVTVNKALIDECFIATAAYGSKFDPAVTLLRQFRDSKLLTNQAGRYLVKLYYTYSPAIAKVIAGNEILRLVVRIALLPVIGLAWVVMHNYLALAILLMMSLIWIKRRHKVHSN